MTRQELLKMIDEDIAGTYKAIDNRKRAIIEFEASIAKQQARKAVVAAMTDEEYDRVMLVFGA